MITSYVTSHFNSPRHLLNCSYLYHSLHSNRRVCQVCSQASLANLLPSPQLCLRRQQYHRVADSLHLNHRLFHHGVWRPLLCPLIIQPQVRLNLRPTRYVFILTIYVLCLVLCKWTYQLKHETLILWLKQNIMLIITCIVSLSLSLSLSLFLSLSQFCWNILMAPVLVVEVQVNRCLSLGLYLSLSLSLFLSLGLSLCLPIYLSIYLSLSTTEA